MKKIIALLLALCMLSSFAFAETVPTGTGTDEVAEEETNPQDYMLDVVDSLWQTGLYTLVQTFNTGSEQITQILSVVGEQLNAWVEAADARYQETRGSIADTALRLLTSVDEVVEKGRYIAAGDEETMNENMAKAEELEGAITKVIELVTEFVEDAQNTQMDFQDQTEARIMETKDTMIDSATEAITSFAEIASNLIYVVTGVADSNAQTRGIPGAENEIPEVAEAANKLQDFLSDLVYFLSTLKDTEPVAVE